MRSESLVVCAFSILQESERRARGCGGLSMFDVRVSRGGGLEGQLEAGDEGLSRRNACL